MSDSFELNDVATEDTGASSRGQPLEEYRSALCRYPPERLRAIATAQGRANISMNVRDVVDEIGGRLADVRVVDEVLAELGSGARMALGLMALTEAQAWPALGLAHSLSCLGVEPVPALTRLLELGLLAARVSPSVAGFSDFSQLLTGDGATGAELLAHPTALGAARTTLPDGEGPPLAGEVHQIRETDGLEPILRLAALWQCVDEAPLRQTQSGSLYKRDSERLDDDPVLAGPIADALEPLPDMVSLWIDLATGLGLIRPEPGTDRMEAAPAEFWAENAVHLTQMIATRWLALLTWQEQEGTQKEGSPGLSSLPFMRPVALLWLARLAEGEWAPLDDLAMHLARLNPGWGRTTLSAPGPTAVPTRPRTARVKATSTARARPDVSVLEAVLLGPAYQLGLIRAGEESLSERRVVQLTPLGRYVLALGAPPPPRQLAEQFLYVQPNFEIIAYRQGLNPPLVGQLSRFARWTLVGAALELKLTPESIYRGLEGGLTTSEILDRLGRHSARPLPVNLSDTLLTWAGRRDRLTYYASATLIEFATPQELALALAEWPATDYATPVQLSDRLLLIEDDSSIPFQRFRLTGARDYRRPAEVCLDVDPDGLTLALDFRRSDLLVDAELARIADELPPENPHGAAGTDLRRFRVSPSSLARAIDNGLTLDPLSDWYAKRTGSEMPAAVRLLLLAADRRVAPLEVERSLVLRTPSAELLDGLLQHPSSRDHLGERLGPTAILVPEECLPALRRTLEELGLALEIDDQS